MAFLDNNLLPGDLWVHVSAPLGLGATVALNRTYKTLLDGGSVQFVSADSNYASVVQRLVVLHSMHKRHGFSSFGKTEVWENGERTPSFKAVRENFHELKRLAYTLEVSVTKTVDLLVVDGQADFDTLRSISRSTGIATLGVLDFPSEVHHLAESRDGLYLAKDVPEKVLRESDWVSASYVNSVWIAFRKAFWSDLKLRGERYEVGYEVGYDLPCGFLHPLEQVRKPCLAWWERL